MTHIDFTLEPVPPFRLDLNAWAIRRRPENTIDDWDGETYRRVLAVGGAAALMEVRQSGPKNAARLSVSITGTQLQSYAAKAMATAALEHTLGTGINLAGFYRFAAGHPRLHELASRFRGLKPPRFPSVFEALVNGIACQQLSLAVGIILLNRLAAACGLPYEGGDGVRHAFPRPEELAAVTDETLRPLGYNRNKIRAIREAASAITAGQLDLESLTAFENEAAIEKLLELRGVGRWTAEYVLLRGVGRLDMFPGDDVGARNNLARWLKLKGPLDYNRVARTLGRWHRYAGLIYFHLLLDHLQESGHLN